MPKCDFIKSEFTLRHECSPLNLLHILRTPFPKNNSGRLLLKSKSEKSNCDVMRHFMISFLEKLKQKYKNFSLLQKNILSAKKINNHPSFSHFWLCRRPLVTYHMSTLLFLSLRFQSFRYNLAPLFILSSVIFEIFVSNCEKLISPFLVDKCNVISSVITEAQSFTSNLTYADDIKAS